jgi:hypothetical protein
VEGNDLAEGFHRKPGPDEVEGDGEANDAEMLEGRVNRLQDVDVGVGHGGESEKADEPVQLDRSLALVHERVSIEAGTIHRARQLDGGSHGQRNGAEVEKTKVV